MRRVHFFVSAAAILTAVAIGLIGFAHAANPSSKDIEQVVPQGDNVVLQNVIVCTDLAIASKIVDAVDKSGRKAALDILDSNPEIPCRMSPLFGFVAGSLVYEGKTLRVVDTSILVGCKAISTEAGQTLQPVFMQTDGPLYVINGLPYRAGVTEHPNDPCVEDDI